MSKIAVVGTGIAGMGCGHFLHARHDLTFFEKNSYIGGHTNTVTVEEDGQPIRIDTGFIVYNEVTYPNLTRLFAELDVTTMPTSMSFSVLHVPSGLEYCGTGFSGLFGQRKNIFNIRFIKMLRQIDRFNTECLEVLTDPRYENYTLARYIDEKGYGQDMRDRYLIPMSSAVWSTSPEWMLEFPAVTLVRFFQNHGFLGLNTQHQWRTVVNGSWSYRDKLIAPFRNRIEVNCGVEKIFREKGRVRLVTTQGDEAWFDKVILACHGDQALRMLGDPTPRETELLGHFRYTRNTATLHTDAAVMPRTKRVWSSWNYRLDEPNGKVVPSTIYWMNSLQAVSQKRDYFLSINDPGLVHPDKILMEIEYEHPLYTVDAIQAQKGLSKLNEDGATYFCGSYFNYGFHEDAFTSALNLSRQLTGEAIWS